MKTERRHELQHNLLADWLEKQTLAIKPYVNVIIGSAIALLLISLVYVYVSHRSAATAAEGCDQLFYSIDSGSPEALNKVVDSHGRDPAGLWAQILLAERRLADGTNALFVNRNDADEQLQKSISGFQNVYGTSHDSDQLQRAVWGLGRAHESRMVIDPKAELTKAKEAYKDYVTKWENGPFASMANRRLKELDRDSTLEFFNWLAKEKPIKLPTPGEKPNFNFPLDDPKFGPGIFDGTGPKLPDQIRSDNPVDFKLGKPGDDILPRDPATPDGLKIDDKTPTGERKSDVDPKPEASRPETDATPAPADEVKKPADEVKKPADEVKKPADEVKTPAAEEKKPADADQQPAEDAKQPAVDAKKPAAAVKQPPANPVPDKPAISQPAKAPGPVPAVKTPAAKVPPVTPGSKPTK